MCTAATYQTKDFYFGRNLDYEFPYGEEVCIVPRSFPIPLRHLPGISHRYSSIITIGSFKTQNASTKY